MFDKAQIKHQHLTEHQNAREYHFERIREAVWVGYLVSRAVQHGCRPPNFQTEHIPRDPLLRVFREKTPNVHARFVPTHK